MGPVEGLVYGLGIALAPTNLLACFIGVLIGTIVGVLPGIGPVGAMALLLPSTFALHPATALIMLAGIYYGSMYGGSTTSILVNVPGEAASVITAIDGYQMARTGRAGAALAVSAVGSFVAGSVGVVGIVLFASWLADLALKFGPPEYFALAVAGLAILSRLSGGSVLMSLLMVGFGLAVGTIGMEPISGVRRFTFGSIQLSQGIELVPVIMGLYGVAEVLVLAEAGMKRAIITSVRLRDLFPTPTEWRQSGWPIARGSVVGFVTGLIPGPATVLATFISYTVERRISKSPDRFGQGAIEGVAGPETANNGATAGAMVPPALARHSLFPGHRDPPGSARDPWHPAGAPADGADPGGVLGRGGQHGRRELPPPHPEPSLGRSVRERPAHAAARALDAGPAPLSGGSVQPEQ
jgi:putative tricarboxylic transport membrane protein